MTTPKELADELRRYEQCDEHGVMCKVSRQAVDEAIAALERAPISATSEPTPASAPQELHAVFSHDWSFRSVHIDVQEALQSYDGLNVRHVTYVPKATSEPTPASALATSPESASTQPEGKT